MFYGSLGTQWTHAPRLKERGKPYPPCWTMLPAGSAVPQRSLEWRLSCMTAGEHYRLKTCILAFIFDLHRSAYCMLWALFSVSFHLHSLYSLSSVGILASPAPLGKTGPWLEFDLEKHLEVPPQGEALGQSGCWASDILESCGLHFSYTSMTEASPCLSPVSQVSVYKVPEG